MKGRKIPSKAAVGLIIGGDLLLLLVGWFLLISPQRTTAASITQATAAAEVQLEDAKRPVRPVKPAPAVLQPEIQTADLYSLAKAMPSTVDQPNMLLEIDQIGRSAGVSVSNIAFTEAQPSAADSFSTVTINLTFKGDFYSITDLLYRLRSLVTVRNGALQMSGRLFSVASVGLTPAAAGGGLTATVSVNAYVYGGAAAAPVVAPAAPAATSTDTTQTTTTPAPSSDVAPAP